MRNLCFNSVVFFYLIIKEIKGETFKVMLRTFSLLNVWRSNVWVYWHLLPFLIKRKLKPRHQKMQFIFCRYFCFARRIIEAFEIRISDISILVFLVSFLSGSEIMKNFFLKFHIELYRKRQTTLRGKQNVSCSLWLYLTIHNYLVIADNIISLAVVL